MIDLLRRLVETPSPFGEERAIAELIAGSLHACGLDSIVQPIDEVSANAIGRMGSGEGPSLLLFAPLDSSFTGRAEDEVPWVGDTLPDYMRAQAIVENGSVTGLGADNPKAHITAMIAAAAAIKKAGARLTGSMTLAFGAGGAPANKRPAQTRSNVGHGAGCKHMLEHGLSGDFAIVCKPGYAVAWEEVGLCWFRIRVRGIHNYVGRRHSLTYRNPIVDAAGVVGELEKWFPEYTARHTGGLCAPQGAVGAIEGGWNYKPSFIPAACDLYVDLRISPRTTPLEAKRELEDALTGIKAKTPGLEYDCEMILAIPGHATDPRNWIVQSCIRGWEEVEQKRHRPLLNTSGQTEAVILRHHGIPTARIGLPPAAALNANPSRSTRGMAKVEDIDRLARCLIYTMIDTCTRELAEVGVPGK
jgi:acetylornithine deacetylase/succinyl-diaminopimelate desuccinylase-like protein